MGRTDGEGKEKLDVSGEAYVSPRHPSILTVDQCESQLSTLTTYLDHAKLTFTVICLIRKNITPGTIIYVLYTYIPILPEPISPSSS